MNAIISGKMEKQAGSMVWKTVQSTQIQDGSIVNVRVNNSNYLNNPYYLKIVDYQDHVLFVNTTCVRFLNTQQDTLQFAIYRSNGKNLALNVYKSLSEERFSYEGYGDGSYYLTNFLKEFSIGVFE
ncbi:MAG TPA: hypothetical protein DCW90_13835 [Lachnospiraceae bacterium]|nr:hypothetical protein [Lachnospiraceae bacterium]